MFVLTCRYLSGDVPNGRKEKQESQENREKCIHVFKRGRVRESVTVFPPRKVFFFPLLRVFSVFFNFSLPRVVVIIPPVVVDSVAPFSPFSGFSLFASYGLSRTLHFVSRGVSEREERERERERARARRRGREHEQRKCVTSRGRS